jgi:Sulfotransferase family
MTLDERVDRTAQTGAGSLDADAPSASNLRLSPPGFISVGGASRSGSTLLNLLLGQLDDAFPVGELRYIWSRGWRMNMLCGCGVPFRDCSFWNAVLSRAYGRSDRVPAAELERLQDSVTSITRLPALLVGARAGVFARRTRRLEDHLAHLCDSIRDVAGARSVIDSSKLPSYCLVLSRANGVNARLVHLVRDSRAVAFSFMRHKAKPDIHWRSAEMKRFSPLKSSLDWNGLNASMEAIARCRPVVRMRYEDLATDAPGQLRRIVPELGGSSPWSGQAGSGSVALTENHSVSGNPLRFTAGELKIKVDAEWRSSMRDRDRRLVTAATAPLLMRYGYI